MLVDSHCHLDFPDFSTELDGVVSRARAAGIGRMVTISTRVKRHAQILAIAERFSEVFCSVGTHPHYSDEELDIDSARLIAIANHPIDEREHRPLVTTDQLPEGRVAPLLGERDDVGVRKIEEVEWWERRHSPG